jgi:thiol-disulfide isomerase/thioredoxin
MSPLLDMTKRHYWLLFFAVGWAATAFGAQIFSPNEELHLPSTGVVLPELTGPWLNVPPGADPALKARRGRVTIVHFWTFGCINCKRNLPYYARWQKEFGKRGVGIVGVHTPETASERNATNVVNKVKELGITYPVLLDQTAQNWKRWDQRVWPTMYLIDKQGRARIAWEGELEYEGRNGYAKMTKLIEALLKE